ncbi:MAG: hypothetical protein AAB074_23160 [Planctomycetota bacterium]
MSSTAEDFLALQPPLKRKVHLALCELALDRWTHFLAEVRVLTYVESVCGTVQQVDFKLPSDALEAAKSGRDDSGVGQRYEEPIAAMQDDDLEFPPDVEFAYYAIYNLFQKYAAGDVVDDWIIVNQALSAGPDRGKCTEILDAAISFARRAPPI